MNKIKILFLHVFCVGLISAAAADASAQTGDKVLASAGGKTLRQSEANKLIEFYEWAFEAKFDAAQRRNFTEHTVKEFRGDPAASRATIDDITGTFAKILAASESVQKETRKNFIAAFIPEARKHEDANSRMLVEIYESANGGGNDDNSVYAGNSDDTEKTDDSSAAAANVGNLSALAGSWVWGRSGSSTYTTGGAYVGANGSRHTYRFNANGSVEYTGIMNVMTGSCNMQIFKTMKGKASLSGNTLTINWSPAAFSREDSCDRTGNYKKTLPAETETLQVRFKTDYDQRQLCLTGKDETCYSPGN